MVEILYPLQLESERLISALPASLDEYRAGTLQLYRNAARDGLAVRANSAKRAARQLPW